MFIINILKNVAIYSRKTIKILVLVALAVIFIGSIVFFYYKPTYAVTLNGEFVGYTDNKSNMQKKINKYINAEEQSNVAFIQVDQMPEYKLCLLKKNVNCNDEEIYAKAIEDGTAYYKYYAITDDKEEKAYVATFNEAEKVIAELKEKDSDNKEELGIVEKYETELKEFTDVEKCVAKLYVEPPPQIVYASVAGYASGNSNAKVDIGISLIQPVSGIITSRFGPRTRNNHRGLDIGAPGGTPIMAAASGTVTTAGWLDDYGYLVVISHGNGVQTAYAHCSQILVSTGQSVSQGEVIAKVGTTGRSTGNHLHLEVRVNGVRYDPQNYVY